MCNIPSNKKNITQLLRRLINVFSLVSQDIIELIKRLIAPTVIRETIISRKEPVRFFRFKIIPIIKAIIKKYFFIF